MVPHRSLFLSPPQGSYSPLGQGPKAWAWGLGLGPGPGSGVEAKI